MKAKKPAKKAAKMETKIESKKGFFDRLFDKMDTSLKKKSDESCCDCGCSGKKCSK